MPPPRYDARAIALMLAQRIASLAPELLPHGKREGREWVAPSPTGTSRRSMSVCIGGEKAGVWSDFSASIGGDALSLVAYVRFGGDIGKSIIWSKQYLGLDDTSPAPAPAPVVQPQPVEKDDREAKNRQRMALGIFLSAEAGLQGSPVADYLAGRNIMLAELGRYPGSLRYAPRLYCREVCMEVPAMVAGIRGPDGAMVAVHRTWLEQVGGCWRKASLRAPKMTLGSYAGGCIPLWRGASGKPLAKAPEGEVVAIGEGIETCLSVAVSCPELRVLSAGSLSNLGRVVLPPQIGTVILLRDADGDNRAAAGAFDRAIAHYQSNGFAVRVAAPTPGCKDFNESLAAE